ncbi:reverse transcriptase domain-containing protein [Tanacetum coccineum]|uniref:Reverse transcriptase domain-containing protein n=1 Tax=Tanacetum coccineum TaxID=301880 RepID=A0ABQ5A534_9ASTR
MLTPTTNPLRVLLMNKPQVSHSKLGLVIHPLGEPLSTFHNEDMYPRLPQAVTYLCTMGPYPTGYVTLFVCWIEDYPLPDGLKMPSHVGSYDEKGDPDNSTPLPRSHSHAKMANACGLPKGKVLIHTLASKRGSHRRIWQFIASKKEKERVSELSPLDLPSTYKGLMEKTYICIEAREVATNEALNDRKDNFERSRKSSEDNGRGHKSRDSQKLRAASSYVGKQAIMRLVQGSKKERAKTSDSQRGEKKEKSTTPTEAPILMINQEKARTRNSISKNLNFEGREIAFPPLTIGSNSSAPVIIEAKIFKREVGRVHMDSGSSCEGKSWAIGEVILEIMIGDAPLSSSETLNFVIVRSNSPYNMLLRRTTMQKMGMVVLMIHGAVKFHTTQGIRTMFSTHESDKINGVKKIKETSLTNTEGVLSCTDAEEKIIVNSKYPEQTITIKKQLPEHFKERLWNLLRTNVDVFARTRADMTGTPKTITVNGKPFNTEHTLNEYSHIKPIKQKRRSLGPDRSTAARKEVEELTRAWILREATHQTWVANPIKKVESPFEIPPKVLPGRLQRLPSDPNGRRRQRQDRKEAGRKADTKLEETKPSCEWKFYTDGASSSDGSGAGLMLIEPEGKEYTYALRLEFETMNNESEYEALLAGLRIAQEMEIVNMAIFVDSQLLVKTKEEESWMTPIYEYLLSGLLPEDFKESRKIKIKAPQYKLIRGSLYKKSFYTPWLRCIAPPKADEVIKEIHEGSCGFNTEPHSMVVRITKQGFIGR